MGNQFEATGNVDDWPQNVPGKPTQAAVMGVLHPKHGKRCEILWTGEFPDLEPAMYWAAKKEMQAIRKEKWVMASRVLWQHELTPEQAVAAIFKTMEPQIDLIIQQYERGAQTVDLGRGPMRAVDPSEVEGHYVEVVPADDDQADPIASFIVPPAPVENADDITWLPTDPRNN